MEVAHLLDPLGRDGLDVRQPAASRYRYTDLLLKRNSQFKGNKHLLQTSIVTLYKGSKLQGGDGGWLPGFVDLDFGFVPPSCMGSR